MRPITRCIVSSAVFAATVAPIAVVWGHSEIKSSQQQQAESTLDRHLDAVAKDYLAQTCYQAKTVTNGAILKLPDAVPASSCVSDGSRAGFVAVLGGQPRVLDVFSLKQVNARISELQKPTTK